MASADDLDCGPRLGQVRSSFDSIGHEVSKSPCGSRSRLQFYGKEDGIQCTITRTRSCRWQLTIVRDGADESSLLVASPLAYVILMWLWLSAGAWNRGG